MLKYRSKNLMLRINDTPKNFNNSFKMILMLPTFSKKTKLKVKNYSKKIHLYLQGKHKQPEHDINLFMARISV